MVGTVIGPPHYLYNDDGSTLLVLGHITNRDERRQLIEAAEWGDCTDMTFLEKVNMSRNYEHLHMRPCPNGPDCDEFGHNHSDYDSWWMGCNPDDEGAVPYTRMEWCG